MKKEERKMNSVIVVNEGMNNIPYTIKTIIVKDAKGNEKEVLGVKIAGNEYELNASMFTMNRTPLHLNEKMTGKMERMVALSTNCLGNPYCIKRIQAYYARMKELEEQLAALKLLLKEAIARKASKEEKAAIREAIKAKKQEQEEAAKLICGKCYAKDAVKMRANLRSNLESNLRLLTSCVLPVELLPVFCNVKYIRLEAFGDLANLNHAINYINIVNLNKEVNFTIWTKNLWILKKAVEQCGGKPSNLIIIESAPIINKAIEPSDPIVDKVFTVYDKKGIEEQEVHINCGGKKCAECMLCYKEEYKDIKIINEKLK